MAFVKSGPKILILTSKDPEQFRELVLRQFESEVLDQTIESFEDVAASLRYDQTLIYLTENARENVDHFEFQQCLVVEGGAQNFLMKIINMGHANLITFVRKAPRVLLMRVIGDMDGTIRDVAEDYEAVIEPTKEIFTRHSAGTVMLFTTCNLNKSLAYSELNKQALYTQLHFSDVIHSLDMHALKYSNRNLKDVVWNEMTIKILDKYGAFKIQYDRLIFVLDRLGAGILLKEGWGESPLRLFSSEDYYAVNYFTHLSPQEIKKILLALEYMENGERIVDFELFFKKKRIHWDEVRVKEGMTREALSQHYRHEMYKELKKDDVINLNSMEDYIFASR